MENDKEIIEGLTAITGRLFDEVVELKKENAMLREKYDSLEGTVGSLFDMQKTLLETIKKNQHEVKMLGETMTRSVDNVPYEMGMGKIKSPKVRTIEETVDELIVNRKSICRYGDGEFSIMMGCSRQHFQKQDDRLAQKLTDVFHSSNENVLIAIADNYGSLDSYSSMSKNEIRYYMTKEVREGHGTFFEEGREYYNAYITTPYMLYGDKNTSHPQERFDRLMEIWKDRDVLIIEGTLTRLGVGNDMLSGTRSIRRILCPPESAFDKYDEILSTALTCGEKYGNNILFLISLGPTATVLAYDIATNGYQALDIGHIDNDYEYFTRNAEDRVLLKGKYINNLTRAEDVEDIDSEAYRRQIIETII